MDDELQEDRAARTTVDVGLYPKSYTLLGVLQTYAPTGTVQQQCTDLYSVLQREAARDIEDKLIDDQLVSILAGYLKDGIDYGNWPWLTPSKTGLQRKAAKARHSTTTLG